MKQSKLVIVIPHYNSPKGLEESIASIDEKINVDIIVVDDGSNIKPNEKNLKQNYKFGQVFFYYLENNSGIGAALNLGLKRAMEMDYKFIGRLDCRDSFIKNKCFKQIKYLEANPDIKLLGTWANVIDEKKQFLYELKFPVYYNEICKKIYSNFVFLHPSVIFYSHIVKEIGHYPYKYRRASQDYAFFFNVIKHFKAENYPEILVNYINEPNSISTKKRRLQVLNRIRIIIDNFYIGYQPIYGLFRNILLLLLSRKITTALKKIIYKK